MSCYVHFARHVHLSIFALNVSTFSRNQVMNSIREAGNTNRVANKSQTFVAKLKLSFPKFKFSMFFSSLNPISLILLSSELLPVENVGQCGKAQPPLATLALVRPQKSSRNWSTQLRWHRLQTCVPRCVVWICLVLRVLAFGACRQNFWAWRVPSMCRARCFNTLIESSKGLQGWNSFRI